MQLPLTNMATVLVHRSNEHYLGVYIYGGQCELGSAVLGMVRSGGGGLGHLPPPWMPLVQQQGSRGLHNIQQEMAGWVGEEKGAGGDEDGEMKTE